MSCKRALEGLYVITDDKLTPHRSIYTQVEQALKGGAKIVQLRDKHSDYESVKQKALKLQELCHKYCASFVLNDKIELACEIECDGLHIGKSDHARFEQIRKDFKKTIGVSCYGDIQLAKKFESMGADYVAFGSFFKSPTKPDSNIIDLDILSVAKSELKIPVCAIGGINTKNLDEVLKHSPDMISVISDIWTSEDIQEVSSIYSKKIKDKLC
jgi:thiamine-phosphate pyrophosphorylase